MKLPNSYHNYISFMGTAMAAISLLLIVFLIVLTSFMDDTSAYFGIIILLVLPAILVLGLLLIPLGMLLKTKKAKAKNLTLKESKFILDLNNKKHRNATFIFLFGTFFFLFATGVGSYELYHFSESVEFCGTVCHEVMKPEYVAYQNSPHAKVTCAQCHIGSGAEWFVKAKISGMYQVYSVLANKYPKPIPTPIENLRPARETCEQCHWPQKFYPNSLVSEKYYLSDEQNTEWQLQLRMKTGSENDTKEHSEGVHWHINPNVQVDYVANDYKRETVPWVRYINKKTCDTLVFIDQDNLLDDNAMDTLEMRTMDCMDCHNRPAHNYLTPATFVNNAMAAGQISKKLPEIKMLAMGIFANNFSNTDTALMFIENEVLTYYRDNYPDIYDSLNHEIVYSIQGLQKEFELNMFPEMKANWDVYPDHIGHMEFDGCFRCHDNNHTTSTGRVISKDCNLCHSIMAQGSNENMEYATIKDTLIFKHPADIGEDWKETKCSECHRYMY